MNEEKKVLSESRIVCINIVKDDVKQNHSKTKLYTSCLNINVCL